MSVQKVKVGTVRSFVQLVARQAQAVRSIPDFLRRNLEGGPLNIVGIELYPAESLREIVAGAIRSQSINNPALSSRRS